MPGHTANTQARCPCSTSSVGTRSVGTRKHADQFMIARRMLLWVPNGNFGLLVGQPTPTDTLRTYPPTPAGLGCDKHLARSSVKSRQDGEPDEDSAAPGMPGVVGRGASVGDGACRSA